MHHSYVVGFHISREIDASCAHTLTVSGARAASWATMSCVRMFLALDDTALWLPTLFAGKSLTHARWTNCHIHRLVIVICIWKRITYEKDTSLKTLLTEWNEFLATQLVRLWRLRTCQSPKKAETYCIVALSADETKRSFIDFVINGLHSSIDYTVLLIKACVSPA